MRPLLIDDYAKSKVRRILDYALVREHWYKPGTSKKIPGHNSAQTTHLNEYRCVFSITEGAAGPFRHLTVSVPSAKFPNPVAAFHIAQLFGFTGYEGKSEPAANWMIDVNKAEHCVVIAQPYEEARATA